jgi:hypothetical protein
MVCAFTTEPHGMDTGVGFSGAAVSLGDGVGDAGSEGADSDAEGSRVGMRSSPGERQPLNDTATTTLSPASALRTVRVRIIMELLSPTHVGALPCNAAKRLIVAR